LKISQYNSLASPQAGDLIPVVDVGDFTMAASGTTKIVTAGALLSLPGSPSNPVTSSSAARPSGLAVVYWYCSSQPANWSPGDVWEQPPAGSIPVISTSSPLTAAITGQAYTTTLAASNSPTSWAVTAGSVPGLSLSNAGVLSGTPTTSGTYTLTVMATNSAGSTAAAFVLTVSTGNLVPNGAFASNVTGWSASNATLGWNSSVLNPGSTGSMAITATSTSSDAQVNSTSFAVNAGQVYAVAVYLRAAATARTTYVNITFTTVSSGFISDVNISYSADSASAWTKFSGNVTAPATAAFASVQIGIANPLALNEVHYADAVSMQ
jgi:hypothetical protein